MLKKLRLKFILVNMTIVTIMLGVVFGMLYYSTARNLEQESIRTMASTAKNPLQQQTPFANEGDVRLPYFTILINNQGDAVAMGGGFFDLSDEEYLVEVLTAALSAEKNTGVLKEYNLRFCVYDQVYGQCVVFSDMTGEQSTLQNLVRTLALVGLLAFVIFLGISLLLARWAVQPVAKAWQQQKQFVADASHELKTPLTVIMTDAELLHSADCPEEDREPLSGNILTMSSQMRGLVESLLDLARMDNGTVKQARSTASFSDIVADSAMVFEPVFFEKGLLLEEEITPDIQIDGIPDHLRQLIGILLDNASKYASPEARAVVKLTRSGRRHCLLEVSNQGEPMSREELQNIFKRFYRADKVRSMNHSYGLGLSIAQGIAEEHHGKIWAESSEGYNRFFAELPCLDAPKGSVSESRKAEVVEAEPADYDIDDTESENAEAALDAMGDCVIADSEDEISTTEADAGDIGETENCKN